MFWIFLLVFFSALGLLKLGALTVTVSVLSLALKLLVVVTIVLLAVFVWRSMRRS